VHKPLIGLLFVSAKSAPSDKIENLEIPILARYCPRVTSARSCRQSAGKSRLEATAGDHPDRLRFGR
jgi:hypothetical protein